MGTSVLFAMASRRLPGRHNARGGSDSGQVRGPIRYHPAQGQLLCDRRSDGLRVAVAVVRWVRHSDSNSGGGEGAGWKGNSLQWRRLLTGSNRFRCLGRRRTPLQRRGVFR